MEKRVTHKQPNFLFIMADQLTALALPQYGNRVAKTPHIDALGAQGTTFANAYCNFPICAPSRFSMLSGQLTSKIGAWDNAAEFPASVPTFLHYLRKLGYHTSLSGKMHFVGPDQLHGYEERLTTDIYPSDFSWTPDWLHEGPPVSGARMSMRSVVEAGLCQRNLQIDYDEEVHYQGLQKLYDLAREKQQKPFFLTVSFTHPHNPFITTQAYWDRYNHAAIDLPAVAPIPVDRRDPHSKRHYYLTRMDEYDISEEQIRTARHAYYGMTSYVDDKIGQLIDVLDETGLGGNTIVILTSDHGEMLGERGMWYKMCLFENAMRVPLIIRLPQECATTRVVKNVSHVDLLPTLLDLATSGDPPKTIEPIDGHSLVPLLRGDDNNWADEVFAEYTAEGAIAPCFMVRKERFKYIWCEKDGGQLFDLLADPHETNDLAGKAGSATVETAMLKTVHGRWDVRTVNQAVLASQRRRLFLQPILMSGKPTPWDYQPLRDASQQYVRSGKSPTITKGLSRLPYVAPAELDHPRPESSELPKMPVGEPG
jgi:choline-sulfatase